MLFAICLARLAVGPHRRTVLAFVGGVLVFELLPVPRTLHSAAIPEVYGVIRADPRPVRVLELPFGLRDGVMSAGDFNASTQFYQTFHEKALIGGYLSRIPPSEVARYRNLAVLAALMDLSENRSIDPALERAALDHAQTLIEQTFIGYVVVDTTRAPPALRAFAIKAFRLVKIAESDGRELYRPGSSPSFVGLKSRPVSAAAQRTTTSRPPVRRSTRAGRALGRTSSIEGSYATSSVRPVRR
jgi:hypothetical protein